MVHLSRVLGLATKIVPCWAEFCPSKKIFFINLFIYLFLTALGLRCWVRAFSSCGERGLLFIAVHGLLIAMASLVAEHGL